MTENRPAITVEKFTELCRMIQTISDERSLDYYLTENGGNGQQSENGPKKVHREWAIYILGQLGVSIQPSEDAREFLKAMGINTHP